MALIRFKRGTRAQVVAAGEVSGLEQGEPYFLTDEDRLVVGTGTSDFAETVKPDELFSGSYNDLDGKPFIPSEAADVGAAPGGQNSTTFGLTVGEGVEFEGQSVPGPDASGEGAIAIGITSKAYGSNSLALGGGAIAAGDYSSALGITSRASGEMSVALGNDSITSRDYTVSVGNPTHKRKIIYVSDGEDPSDAATVGQTIPKPENPSEGDILIYENGEWVAGEAPSGGGEWSTSSDIDPNLENVAGSIASFERRGDVVFMNLSIGFSSATSVNFEHLLTIPPGFRPLSDSVFTGVLNSQEAGKNIPGIFMIADSSGEKIVLGADSDKVFQLMASVTWITNDDPPTT